MTLPEASVIIPTYKDWQTLQLCLDCLAAQTAPAERFEIVIANNNPGPEVPASLRLPANARVIHATTPGSYAARNAALAEVRGDVLFFTDSDCLPEPGWIEAGLARIATLGPIDRVAGAVVLFAKAEVWTAPELYDRATWLRQAEYVTHGWGATANLITRKAAFAAAGPFDGDTYSGGDREWNQRAGAVGSSIVYGPDAVVRHPARSSFAELAKKRKRLLGGRHRIKVRKSWKRWLPPIGYLIPSVSGSKRIFRLPDLTLRERWAVWLVEYRLRIVTFTETMRLRFFSGSARRS
jgi:glycosyltransferase involved in cell wall biosynthesis